MFWYVCLPVQKTCNSCTCDSTVKHPNTEYSNSELKMPTKKKIGGGNSARDPASQKVSRFQKKASENGHVTEKKASDIITSSARKQKIG